MVSRVRQHPASTSRMLLARLRAVRSIAAGLVGPIRFPKCTLSVNLVDLDLPAPSANCSNCFIIKVVTETSFNFCWPIVLLESVCVLVIVGP